MFDTEKFILEIEQRPCVYAVTSKEYSNRRLKAQSWNEIGEIMVKRWSELTDKEKDEKAKYLMKKWKAIRDNFVRELKAQRKEETEEGATRRKTYVYYDQLLFLTPHVLNGERTTSKIAHAESITYDANENSTQQSAETENTTARRSERQIRQHRNKTTFKAAAVARSIASTTKTLTSVLSESVKLQREERTADKFGNKAFLMSYLPVMDNLPMNLQMHARCKISEMFNEFTFSYD